MKTVPLASAIAHKNATTSASHKTGGLAAHIQSALTGSHPSGNKMVVAPKTRIKVMLVDDQPIGPKGVSSCLARHEHLQIVAEAADGREAVAKARQLLPH